MTDPLTMGEMLREALGVSGRMALILASGLVVLIVVDWLFTRR